MLLAGNGADGQRYVAEREGVAGLVTSLAREDRSLTRSRVRAGWRRRSSLAGALQALALGRLPTTGSSRLVRLRVDLGAEQEREGAQPEDHVSMMITAASAPQTLLYDPNMLT